ncbi:hypothetical protein K490DRAFT_67065 [Saccharata proteae CBS 121410]|uniref:DNA/RNA-binding protein Alba-like domain-containing protein n=1 Tax=Saccharata proteae CBS 121410 TaxID=1314787 RepID=A0A9P4LW78_9PEZI|nr:hypothetical protein K490DRAFT_67065 [Saccharata proteae CBS 121410]
MAKKKNFSAETSSSLLNNPAATSSNKRRRITPDNSKPTSDNTTNNTAKEVTPMLEISTAKPSDMAAVSASSPVASGPSPESASFPAPPTSALRVHVAASSKISAKVRAVLQCLGAESDTQRTAVQRYGDRLAVADPVLQAPTTNVEEDENKSHVVMLEASSEGANKLVSVVEIAKRELEKTGAGDWWEYSAVRSAEEGEFRKEGKQQPGADDADEHGARGADGGDDADDGERSEAAFEDMDKLVVEGRKERDRSVLIVYLSRRQVPELKEMYGEQSSSDKR